MSHHVILVPGLGDKVEVMDYLTRSWKKEGVTVHIHPAPWLKVEPYNQKFKRLLRHIDQLSHKDRKITLIGVSAGGSLALNAFAKRKHTIHKVINISGRVRKGRKVFPTLDIAARGYPAFRESVIRCEHMLTTLSKEEKRKIMTLRGFFDETVPPVTTVIPGAWNHKIPWMIHIIAIWAAYAFYSSTLLSFILA